MSWYPTEIKENGNQRRFVVVLCDSTIPAASPKSATVVCHTQTEIPARERDNAERIQRILVARGWTWGDVVDGARDYCHALIQRLRALDPVPAKYLDGRRDDRANTTPRGPVRGTWKVA